MRRFARTGFAALVFYAVVVACGRANETPAPPVTTLSPSSQALLDLMWAITPGMSTQDEVVGLLGEAAGTEEPLLGEWTWLYRPDGVPGTLLRVTFDTGGSPPVVLRVEATEIELNYGGLEAELGAPVVVYQVEGEPGEIYMAYPDRGFTARLATADPQPLEQVTLLRREAARSVEDLLRVLSAQPGVSVLAP
jgi:hypothetical protein